MRKVQSDVAALILHRLVRRKGQKNDDVILYSKEIPVDFSFLEGRDHLLLPNVFFLFARLNNQNIAAGWSINIELRYISPLIGLL